VQAGSVRVGRGRLAVYPFRALLAVGALDAVGAVGTVDAFSAMNALAAMDAAMASLYSNCLYLQGQQKRKADQRKLTQHDSAGP
jgi:hypothetical protein